MSDADTALQLLELAAKLGPPIVEAVSSALSQHRPELVPAPPASQAAAIEAEDEALIRKRFLSG
jgi:hypothetical protein